MWETLVVESRYRCLIPLTHFANPNGTPGEKTRSWFSLEGQPIVAWAGFCKNTAEFGPVYAGMTMEANGAAMPYNERMPVLLEPHEYARWLHGRSEEHKSELQSLMRLSYAVFFLTHKHKTSKTLL